jgi:hypothetical protein
MSIVNSIEHTAATAVSSTAASAAKGITALKSSHAVAADFAKALDDVKSTSTADAASSPVDKLADVGSFLATVAAFA